MADERKIVIELRNVDAEGKSSGAAKNGNNESSNEDVKKVLNSIFHPIKTAEHFTVGRNVLVNQAYQQAKQTIKSIGQYHIYKYFALKEDYLGETKYNNIMSGVNRLSSFGTAVGAGTLIGLKAGMPFAGAIISTAGWVAGQAVQSSKILLQQQIQINQNNYQSNFQQTRLGLIDGRGVTNQ